MTVYVESNFVLPQTLQQEQSDSCDAIVNLAAQALAQKEKTRNRLNNELQQQLSELGRSKPYRSVPDDFSSLASVLIRSADQERDGLQRVIGGLLRTAEVIPLDAGIVTASAVLQTAFAMSGQDAIVLASVLQHLERTKPAESCFLNRNSRDFDDPDVRERLDRFGCRFFGRFDDGYQFIRASLDR